MKEKLLTKQIAEQFLAGEIESFYEYTKIDEAAAEVLAQVEGEDQCLSLDSLSFISTQTARSLANFRGFLGLNGLEQISEDVANELSNHVGEIALDGLKSLPPEVAKALARHEGDLNLNGIRDLSDESAAELSLYSGFLCVVRIEVCSDDAVRSLATIHGNIGMSEHVKSRMEALGLIASPDANDCSTSNEISQELIEAMASGDLAEVARLRSQGLKVCATEGFYSVLSSVYEEHCDNIFSTQINPDTCKKIISFEELDAACGPFFVVSDACLSISSRPMGWASFVIDNRVLSWSDGGFGIMGDQIIDIDRRLVSTKPMTTFGNTLVSGPLPDNIECAPEGFIQPDLQRAGLNPGSPDMAAMKALIAQNVALKADLEWTKQFSIRQYTKEILEASLLDFMLAAHNSPDVYEEFLLYISSSDSGDENRRLSELIQPTKHFLRRLKLLELAQAVAVDVDCGGIEQELVNRVNNVEVDGEAEKALKQLLLHEIAAGDGNLINLEALEMFSSHFRNSEHPLLSGHIQLHCSKLAGCLFDAAEEDAIDADFLMRLSKCGFRMFAVPLLIKALNDDSTELLEYLISCGISAKGHAFNGMNFAPLITAVHKPNPIAVRLLLAAGADPLEPTHYGGASTLQQSRFNFSGNPDATDDEKTCLKLLEKAVKNDPRVAWLAPALDDSE